MSVRCPNCSYVMSVSPGEGPRPWCPRCGSDLRHASAAQAPADLAAASASSVVVQSPAYLNGNAITGGAPKSSALDERAEPDWVPSQEGDPATTPEAVFTSKFIWQAAAWLTAIVCFGIAAIALSQFINPPKKKVDPGVLWGVAGLFGVGGIVGCYVGVGLSGQKYVLFPDRLVAYQFFKPTSLRWNQIRAVYRDVHPIWKRYRIMTPKGKVITVAGETVHYVQLGEIISERVAAVLLPDALRQLEAGQSVSLGPLRLDHSGIALHGELVPWHEVIALTVGLNPNPVRGNGGLVSNMMHLRITPLR